MSFPNQNLFGKSSFESQNPTEMQSTSTSYSSSFRIHSTSASSFTSGSFGTLPTMSSSFGKWPSVFSSSTLPFPVSSETNTRFVNTKPETVSSQLLFGMPVGSTSASPHSFSFGQTPSVGFSMASGGTSLVSGMSNRSSDSSFASQTVDSNFFPPNRSSVFGKLGKSEAGESSKQSLFGKELNEPSRPVLFGKVVSTEGEGHNVESQREASRKTKPPDLMSLSPMNVIPGGGAKLFGMALANTAVDQAPVRGHSARSPPKERNTRPTSSRHVVLSHKLDKDSKDSETSKNRNISGDFLGGGGGSGGDNDGQREVRQEPALRRRRVMSDVDKKVLIVKGIPARVNNQARLKSHFMHFGNVEKISVNPKANSATVFFNSHESAERAKEHGRYLPGIDRPILMFWRAEPKQRAARLTSENKEAIAGASSAKISPHHQKKTEIDEELVSMQGTEDVQCDVGPKASGRPLAGVESLLPEASSMTQHQRSTPPPPPPPPASNKTSGSLETFSKIVEGESGVLVNSTTFKSLAGSVGRTAGEKVAILEIRDRLLKTALGNQKQADLATAKAIRGTCPDMCPEKERYMREDRRRLSYYEIIPGTDQQAGKLPQVDHARAVKEYSRSSADQDMPLPQELRPPEVLDATMNYLLTHIVDTGGAGKWAEWYDFLWNRMRSIRKDITQQHLCDPTAVSLVEKCARFHIYCSEVLCEEDVAIFDPKINNENLTKCLQTLKELYHDLHVRQNIACLENEGEFVMYMVLMNLNKGDTLREVQQLNSEVRESDYVNFSIQIYSALNSTNYVKFFKLVRVAPFLGACILHRYFNQIRISALQRMIKAYTQPGHGTAFPISELMRQLGFETAEEVENFSRHHGLVVENGQVILDKNRLSDSEAFPVCRSLNLVEGKQNRSLGEVINGGPLPPCVIREPSSSFDENCRFICGDDSSAADVKLSDAEAQPTSTSSVTVMSSSDHLIQPTAPTQLVLLNEAVKDVARKLILELLNTMFFDIAQSEMDNVQLLLSVSDMLAEDLLADACVGLIRNECQTVVSEFTREREEQQRIRRREMVLDACDQVSTDILTETVMSLMRSIAYEEHSTMMEVTHKRAFEAVTETFIEQLIQDVCTADGDWICHNVFMTDVTERLETLSSCRKSVERLHLGRVFRKWKAQFSAHRRLRQAMETFPPAPSMEPWPVQFACLVPGSDGVVSDSLHLGGSASITLKPPQELYHERVQLSKDISHCKAVSRWQHELSWFPFDLSQMMTDLQLPQKFSPLVKGSNIGSRFYWKLIVAFPEVNVNIEEEFGMHNWLKAKFSNGRTPVSNESEPVNILSLSSVPLKESNVFCSYSSTNICVVSVTNHMPHASIEKNHLLGSSGILFILSHSLSKTHQLWKKEVERLRDLLATKPQQPPIPLAVVRCSLDSLLTEAVIDSLNLQRLKSVNIVSDFKVFSLDSDVENPQTANELEVAVRWLMSHCPKPVQITGVNIRDFIEDGVSSKFFSPALENLAERRKKGFLQMTVNRLIQLYNDVIQYLASFASNTELSDVSWPMIEFSSDHEDLPDASWNSLNQLQRLHDLICRLTLPEFSHSREEHADWSEACADVWNYVDAVIDDNKSCSHFLSRIDVLLRKAEHQFKLLCRPSPWSSLDNCPLPLYANFPWLDFIMICIEYRIDCILTADRETEDLKVYFLSEAVESRADLSLSLEVDLEMSSDREVKLLDTVVTAVKRKRLSVKDDYHLPIRKKYSVNLSSDLELSENAEKLTEQKESLDHLKSALKMEKKESSEFEEFLRKSLDLGAKHKASSVFSPPNRPTDNLEDESPSVWHCTFPDHSLVLPQTDRTKFFKSSSSINDKIKDLNVLIKSEKTADRLFEIYLENSILNDSK